MIKIAFFDTKDYDREMFDKYNSEYNYEITYFKTKLNEETAVLATGFDVVCIFVNDSANKVVLEKLKSLGVKLIALRCAGYNNVEISHLPSGLGVVRVPAYSPYAVAEHTAGLLLALDRKVYKSYQRTKKYNFSLDGLLGFDIHGKTVGVIGTGKIGKVFINIMNGFGANVIAYDVYQDKKAEEELNFKYTTLDEIYKNADIISLHCPLTEENHNMINKDSIAKMKKGVILLNTSRGKLINAKDLVDCLEKGMIGGVGLDVFEDEEEYFLNDMSNSYIRDAELSILLSMPNVVITAHQAFFTKEALEKIVSTTLSNIKEYIETGKCENIVE
ncbi:d-lactate dehydrogenase [Clostridium sp. CAG:1219]|nr:d-lactate dehydrogenase [Clostridium sp. CAG:1219]